MSLPSINFSPNGGLLAAGVANVQTYCQNIINSSSCGTIYYNSFTITPPSLDAVGNPFTQAQQTAIANSMVTALNTTLVANGINPASVQITISPTGTPNSVGGIVNQ